MSKNYIFTNKQGEKIVARLLEQGDRWGINGEYLWDNDSLTTSKEYEGDGIEFYLYDSGISNYKYSADNWITRYYATDFIDEAKISDNGEILICSTKEDYILTEDNVRSIIEWLDNIQHAV
jgi:hypothetical protein